MKSEASVLNDEPFNNSHGVHEAFSSSAKKWDFSSWKQVEGGQVLIPWMFALNYPEDMRARVRKEMEFMNDNTGCVQNREVTPEEATSFENGIVFIWNQGSGICYSAIGMVSGFKGRSQVSVRVLAKYVYFYLR